MFEAFKDIDEFPGYAVSNLGRVISKRFGRELTYSPTEYGDLTVGLMKDRQQFRRSVKGLVARAWVEGETLVFDTPIHKDGDRRNVNATNLAWRPRWFAWRYHQQFDNIPHWTNQGPVVETRDGNIYDTIYDAAIATGSFFDDIRRSITYGRVVFPSASIYRFV